MSINNLFNVAARPCSRVAGNRIKPNFTFVRNWETVVSPPAQVTNGKEQVVTSGVLISPRPHISHNSSFSSIAENSPTPVIISHTTSNQSEDNDDNEEEMVEEEQEKGHSGDNRGADDERGDDAGDDVSEDEEDEDDDGGRADDEEEVHSQQSANGAAANKEGGEGEMMEVSSGGQAQSDKSSDRNVPASHLMPPPPAPTVNNTDELPDVSPIPAAVGVVAYKTPASAGIKRPSSRMTSTPAHLQKESPKQTPGFEVIDTAKRLKQPANTFVPARKRPTISKPVSTQEQSGSQASDNEQHVMPEVQLWVGAGPLRRVSDTTELDVLLTAVEDISYEFKQKNPNPMKKKTVNGFVLKVRKEVTDVIDSVQELKSSQSALTRTTHSLKMAYQELVQKQNKYFNLLEQEASLEREKKAVEKQAAMRDVSEWLFKLEDLQARYKESVADKQVKENYNTRENLPALLKETITSLSAAKKLKNANDQVERLIETRLNSSRHGRHLRDVLK
ncbi:nucleolar and coiled-body phosphoprotein 1-like isoform X2 [Lineus longissimus]|uniref:nucleolar and coiled-body phosphoprotein 1-like isoform X2 n=1 Tax=Lineus longissimus TaxID=88925 RepID=UPI00315DEFF7